MSKAKSILVITRQAPYGNNSAREALDAALTGAIFEQDVAMLFMSDAIFQLLPNHNPAQLGQKNLSSNLQVLPMYDIEKLFVCSDALQQRNISDSELAVAAQPLTLEQIPELIQQYDVVLNF